MREVIENARQTFTGVLPAEPGWRVIVTNGATTYIVPVVGWAWERTAWADDDSYSIDSTSGEALVAGVEGLAYVETASELVKHFMSGDGWRVEGLLAPGKTLGDRDRDGWQQIDGPPPTRVE